MQKKFGSVIDERLHRRVTSTCKARGIRVQEAMDEAFRLWLGDDPTTGEKTGDDLLAAKLLTWFKAEDGGPAEKGLRCIIRDLINDSL